MQIYTGVPIGGTIAWLGHLAGIDIPDNFIFNHLILPVKPRAHVDFSRENYDDWEGEGYLSGTSASLASKSGINSFSLSLNNLPAFKETYSGEQKINYNLAALDARVDLGAGIETANTPFNFNRVTGNDWSDGTLASQRFFPSAAGFSQDGGNTLSGTGHRKLYNEGVYDTDTLNQHTHVHGPKTTPSHTHGVTLNTVAHRFIPRGDSVVNGTQTPISYQVRPPAIGVLWITRVY
ncbi:hypothetical protein S140_122 [Shewanella sp. phage 1/40]|uniref:hypothetical protein n=1 Tax=Shewanella sp. phage 1/40 TaxID=1458860 RepID=UPI0004F7DA9A|nr:hypothetical protein S140_122 [Shewanella sp. phage 1/40]AHK11529.1 hypothetical protein S140_122 [Shewanella sp. phage 1/40]